MNRRYRSDRYDRIRSIISLANHLGINFTGYDIQRYGVNRMANEIRYILENPRERVRIFRRISNILGYDETPFMNDEKLRGNFLEEPNLPYKGRLPNFSSGKNSNGDPLRQIKLSSPGSGMQLGNQNAAIIKLKDINLNPFAKKGDTWNEKYVIWRKQYNRQGANVLTSVKNSKRFQSLTLYLHGTPLRPNNSATFPFSFLNITAEPESHFNSVNQLQKFVDDPEFTVDGWVRPGSGTIVHDYAAPEYEDAPPYDVANVRGGNNIVGLKNQYVYIRLKNVSKNATATAGVFTSTPVLGKIFVCQAKKDIYDNIPGSAGINIFNDLIREGFDTQYANQGGSQLIDSIDQNLSTSAYENTFLNGDCKIVAVRPFTIYAGQEVHLKVSLTKKQILSMQFQKRAKICDPTPGAVKYGPVVIKKGESFIIVEQQGGLAFGTDNSTVLIEETKLLAWINQSFEGVMLNYASGKLAQSFQTENMATVVSANDVDLDHIEEF